MKFYHVLVHVAPVTVRILNNASTIKIPSIPLLLSLLVSLPIYSLATSKLFSISVILYL